MDVRNGFPIESKLHSKAFANICNFKEFYSKSVTKPSFFFVNLFFVILYTFKTCKAKVLADITKTRNGL